MKTIKSVLIGALIAFLGSSAQAASQTVNTSVKVGERKNNITSTSNVTGSNRSWSQQTGADASVATVSLTSSNNVKKPTISVTGVGAGYTTYVAKNGATTGGDKGLTFTCNITVTDSKDETVKLGPGDSVQKTCTYSGKYKSGTTDGNWSATTTDGSVATVSSVSGSAAEVKPTITAGSKIGTATVTVKNAYVTYTYTVEVKEPKSVVCGQTLFFSSTKNVTANWYYRVVSADGNSVGVSPAEATQQGGQAAPVEIEVEGLDVTESPVTITLQQRQWQNYGSFSDVETFEVVVTEPPFVDYGTNTVVIAKGKTSDALSVESAASAQWKFWSEDTSVATVSKATGATAKSDNFTITAVDTEGKSTYCVASNKYAKYTFKVEGPKVEVDMGEIMMSHGECVTLTNKLGEAIAWTGVGSDTYTTENPDVAKVVSSNGFACVTNMVHDGAVEVILETAKTNYTYLVRCMTVEIEKTIKALRDTDPNDRSNATIRVTTHVLYGVHEIPTNKILFITSTCSTHGLTEALLKGQIDTLATKGAVDYFFYAHANNATDAAKTDAAYEGHLAMSNKLTRTIDVSSGKHYNLKAYLNCLSTKLDLDHKNYDYVVLSFDSARLGNTYPKNNKDMEADVAAKLRWYYENDRVIWITDAVYDGSNKTGTSSYLDYDTWEALCAIMDPITYCTKPAGSRYVSHSGSLYQGTKNTLQAVYTDKTATEKMLSDNVKMATYDTELVDKVLNLNKSLSIVPTGSGTKQEVHFYTWAGKSAPVAPTGGVIADLPKGDNGWKREPDSAFKVDTVNYQVTANVSNITQETWNMFEISIVDNGTFLQECIKAGKAEYDEKTGKYKVDPNDGPAHVTLYSMEGGKKYEVQSTAKATTTLWPLDLIPLKIYVDDAEVTYGDEVPTTLGWKDPPYRYDLDDVDESKINGLKTVTFGTTYTKGSPVGSNYSINTNSVDLSSAYYDITVVPGTLTVKPATIKPVKPGEEPPEDGSPYTLAPCIERTYDGNGTNITAKVVNIDDATDVPTFLYSLNEDGPFWPWDQIEIKNVELDGEDQVTSNKVWYTVTTKTAGGDENYFAATNFAYVKINPRLVTVIAADSYKPYDGTPLTDDGFTTFPSPATVDAGFVEGEGIKSVTMTEDSTITNVGTTDNVIETITPMSGTLLENYSVTTNSGTLEVWQSDMTADDADAWKTYDGIATNITVTPKVSGCEIYYAPEPNNKKDETRVQPMKLFAAARRVDPDDVPDYLVWGEKDVNVTYMDACVSNKVWYMVKDPTGNHSNVYGYAFVTIEPREVKFRFPKAEKPYDGNGDYENLVTNLVGTADNMVGDEQFDCTGSGVFTNVNVGAGENYFVLNSVKLDAGVNTFFRNYTIKYWADGDYNELTIGSDKDHAESVTIDTTALPNGTDGEITIVPMVIGGVTQPGEPGKQIPIDPENPNTWTNGAESVAKEYDAKATNIVVEVTDPAVATVYYCYDDGTGKPTGDWKTYENFDGYTDVTNAAPVWYKVEYPNYLPVTNRAFVTITARQIQGKKTKNEPWAQATSVECFIDEIPEGGTTNILVTTDGFFGSDNPKLEFMTKDGWSEIGVYTNWCTVSCEPNYLPTNLMATVKIKEREGDVEGDTEPENAEEIAEQMKDVAKAAGEFIKETTGEDPIYVEVRLLVNSTNNLPQAEQAQTAKDAKKLEEKFDKDYPNYENVKGECVDVKLELTTDPNRVKWTNIGSNNDVMVDIELTPECALDEIVAIYRCHYSGSTVSYNKIAESTTKPSGNAECWWRNKSKGVVHFHVKKFSLFEIFTGKKVTPPTPPSRGCQPQVTPVKDTAWVYEWKFTGKTTDGVLKTTDGVAAGCLVGAIPSQMEAVRVPASLKIQGYTVKCNPTCLDIEKAAFVGSSRSEGEAFWITKPTKGAFYDAGDGVPGVSFRFGNVIGRSSGKYELVGRFRGSESFANETYDLQFAGQGSYDASKLRVTSISGSFAGTMVVPRYLSYVKELHGCPEATAWDCMGVRFLGIDGRERTAAFGKWKMKYCATASKNFAAGKGRPVTKNGAKWGY